MRAILLCVCLIFLTAQMAFAENATFGNEQVKYSIEIPQTWKKKDLTNGIQLTSEDAQTSLAISLSDKEGLTVESIYQLLPSRLGLTDVNKQEKKNSVEIRGMLKGQAVQITFIDLEDCYLSIVAAGSDKKAIADCLATLKEVVEASQS